MHDPAAPVWYTCYQVELIRVWPRLQRVLFLTISLQEIQTCRNMKQVRGMHNASLQGSVDL